MIDAYLFSKESRLAPREQEEPAVEAPTAPNLLDVQKRVDGQTHISAIITPQLHHDVSRTTVIVDIAGAAAAASLSSDVGAQPSWQHRQQLGRQGVSEAWLRKQQARAVSHAPVGRPPPNDAASAVQQARCPECRRNHP
ncbi:MAG: hypothetical protein ACKPKO_43155, partial [Candidatus Fonsibacter sp.]